MAILLDFQKVREDKQEVEYIFGVPEKAHRGRDGGRAALRPYDGELEPFRQARPGRGSLFDEVGHDINFRSDPDGREVSRKQAYIDAAKRDDPAPCAWAGTSRRSSSTGLPDTRTN